MAEAIRAAKASSDRTEAARAQPAEQPQALTPRRSVTPANHLQGPVDEVRPSGITGWVWDPRQPQQRISLDLMDGETRLAR
jgi:hypothetical protein